MKAVDSKEVRCPYKAGETPDHPDRLCLRCEISRNPSRAGDRGKHLECTYTPRKHKDAGKGKKQNDGRRQQQARAGREHSAYAGKKKKASRTGRRNRYFDGYDGYYEDVLPIDDGGVKQGLDTALAQKIVVLIMCVLLVVGICVCAMYYL